MVGERVDAVARRERERARAGGEPLVGDLERELAVEHVERLVELVVVQRRPGPAGRDRVAHDRDAAVASARCAAGPRCGMAWEAPCSSRGRRPSRASRSRRPQRDLAQQQHDQQPERGERRGDQEHGLERVARRAAARRAGAAPPAAGEDRAEHRDADRAAERADEVRRRGRDAQVAPLDGVLERDREHLGDHAEAEPEHDEQQRRGRACEVAGVHAREQQQPDGHQRRGPATGNTL